jgi:hypothetical protein
VEIGFDCGTIVYNVGEPLLAMRYHLTICDDESCMADVGANIVRIFGKGN